MVHDTWLLESGGGFSWALEDGSGLWLLEDQSGTGLHIEATHAVQTAPPEKKTEPKLTPTKLIIKLKADLITSISVNIPSIKLLPMGIFTERLKRAFTIPTGHIKEKLTKYLKEESKIMRYELFLDKYGELGILALVKRLLWKK